VKTTEERKRRQQQQPTTNNQQQQTTVLLVRFSYIYRLPSDQVERESETSVLSRRKRRRRRRRRRRRTAMRVPYSVRKHWYNGRCKAPVPNIEKKRRRVSIYDKQYYRGQLYKGKFHGRGLMRWSDTHYYYGDWQDGMIHGEGIFVDEGETYEGEWEEDHQHGRGVLLTSDGEYYEGSFAYGYRSGNGCYKWPNGITFVGYFDEDKREGEGVLQFSDGRQLTAVYFNDERYGTAKMEWPPTTNAETGNGGDLWEGEFIDHNTAEGVKTFAETGDTLEGVFTDCELKNGGDEKTESWMTYTRVVSEEGKKEVRLGIWRNEQFIPREELVPITVEETTPSSKQEAVLTGG